MSLRLTAIAFILTSLCFGDTLTLKSGRVVQGTFVGGDARQIRLAVGSAVESFPIHEIDRLEFGESAAQFQPPAPPPAAEERYRERPPAPVNSGYQTYPAPPAREAMGMQVPAGAVLSIRLIDSVDSERDRPGQTFRASLDEPVMVNGSVVIPRGADVVAKLVDMSQSGKISGRTELTLDLESIVVNGRRIEIATQDVSQASGSRGAQTATRGAGGAALGAIIGALAGGGRGAAIGAVSGTAVGVGSEVVTHGQRVKIPSEARLSFTLQQPINL